MGFFGGGGVASSAAQGATSNARDPAVRRTGTSTGTQTRGSSPRPPSRKPTQLERSVYNFTGNIARDLTMGLSTFGQSGERQAQTLRDRGYSDDVISDYQARTAASAARRSERLASRGSGGDDRRPTSSVLSPAVARQALSQKSNVGLGTVFKGPPTPPSDAAAAKSAPVTVGGAPELVTVGQTSAASGEMDAAAIEATAEGAAEKNVAETARKGRRSTIQTGAQGLLTTARTRRRRSLMGGEEPMGLIE